MLTTSLALRPQLHARQILGLFVAGALVTGLALAAHAIIDFQDFASDHLVEFSTSYKSIPDLATLRHQSDLVIVGRVVGDGTTRFATPAGGTPANNSAPQTADVTGKKADALKSDANVTARPALTGNVVNTIPGTPVSTFNIQVERVLQGNTSAGSRLVVTQPGGHVTLDMIPNLSASQVHRTIEFEHDTLMQSGEQHVMFLQRAADGTFFVLGGPQGRLSVDRSGKLHPIDTAAPALRGYDGKLLESLVSEVGSANQTGAVN
jgi:hypothetical protein